MRDYDSAKKIIECATGSMRGMVEKSYAKRLADKRKEKMPAVTIVMGEQPMGEEKEEMTSEEYDMLQSELG